VVWEARAPGKWLPHRVIKHHTAAHDNREEQGGGPMLISMSAPEVD
jgi:hypothetical protein